MSYLDPPPQPAPIVIVKDVGGVVRDYQAHTELYRMQNREVRLHECRSACTLALSLPNVCVYPDSILKFHQAYNQTTREVDYGVSDELWNAYPVAVRQRLGELTRNYKVLRGWELIALGVRDCGLESQPPEIMIARANPPKPVELPTAQAQAYAPVESNKGDDVLKSAQSAVASLFSSQPNAPQTVASQTDLPPQPPRVIQAKLEMPVPPPRPPMIGILAQLPTTPPPAPDVPAYLRMLPGATPIVEAHFTSLRPPLLIPLRAASRTIATNEIVPKPLD